MDKGITQAIKQSDYVLLLATRSAVESDYVRDEIEFANQHDRQGIVVTLEPCELPLRASNWVRIDFAGRYSEGLAELKKILLLGRTI